MSSWEGGGQKQKNSFAESLVLFMSHYSLVLGVNEKDKVIPPSVGWVPVFHMLEAHTIASQ